MNEDIISRKEAYKVLTSYFNHHTDIQHKTLRDALKRVPSVDIDLSDYSDRLWRKAYEQGKAVSKDALDEAYAHGYTAAEADFHKKNQWIPVTERLPKDDDWQLVTILDESGDSPYRYSDFGWYLEAAKCWIVEADQRTDIVAWMPLPEPWKGEDDAETDLCG